MPIQELAVGFNDGVWEVRVGDHQLATRPTQMEALSTARTIADAAAVRGVRSKIIVGNLDGHPIEFPMIEPALPVGK